VTTEMTEKALSLRCEGKEAHEIAAHLKLSVRTVHRIITDCHDALLTRTGREPIALVGRTVARVCGKHLGQKAGESATDYWEITIFEQHGQPEDAPRYGVSIVYNKELGGKSHTHYFAELTDKPMLVLGKYDPLSVLVGYPDTPNFDEKQRQLEEASLHQYRSLVSDALRGFPENAAEAYKSQRDGELCDIFMHLCHTARQEWTFTKIEACAIIDACEHTFVGYDAFMLLSKEILSGIDANGLVEKWHIDRQVLADKLQSLSLAGLAALAV